MKRIVLFLFWIGLPAVLPVSAGAGALGSAARSVIPSDVQQVISVDYRQVMNSPTATELHDRVLPENLKQFVTALKGVGIDAPRDIDQLTFAAFRDQKQLHMVGVAEGQFPLKNIIARFKARKIAPTRFHTAFVYPMGNGMSMSVLDESTMVFGDLASLKLALSARDGDIRSLDSNSPIGELMPAVASGAVWSVRASNGTQPMSNSAMGDVAKLGDYEMLRKRLLSSRYAINFGSSVNFDLDVITSDDMTAAGLTTIMQEGMMFKKMQASGAEKTALESMSVDHDSNQLKLHFKSDDKQFQSLLSSDLFAAVIR
jgi:hypothetical protein